ncbi:MAG TPA: hypothetical protein VGE07_22885, partial [Herpetosiphonaceae bacterium]
MDHNDATQALARRIRLLAAIQGAMGAILWVVGLMFQETVAEQVAASVGGAAAIGISAALFWAARRPWATAAATANFMLIVSLVAALDPIGGSVSGASWSLYLIWPSLAALVLRRLGPSLAVSLYALALL